MSIRADVETVRAAISARTGMTPEAYSALWVLAAQAQEGAWSEGRFPCDAGCVNAPEEMCSRHGRTPKELWELAAQAAWEFDVLSEALAAAGGNVTQILAAAEKEREKGESDGQKQT